LILSFKPAFNPGNRKNVTMSNVKKTMTVEEANAAIEEALTRLERAVLDRGQRRGAGSGEQGVYIEQLETENRQMARDMDEMKKHCIALKKGYEALEEKCARLANANDSAERELAATLRDLDKLIAQKSLH